MALPHNWLAVLAALPAVTAARFNSLAGFQLTVMVG
jgi:hypothetical protein